MAELEDIIADIESKGPYITTENFECEDHDTGRLRFRNPRRRADTHLTFVDLVAEQLDGTEVFLRRVETGKIISMARDAERDAEIVSNTNER